MAYLNSTQIKVFPAVNRSVKYSGDPYSRHTSEETISSIVNKLIDTNGFVITQIDENYDIAAQEHFAFNIYGYYFNVSKLDNIINLWNEAEWVAKGAGTYTIYAKINIAARGKIDESANAWHELAGQDEQMLDITGKLTDIYKYTSIDFLTELPSIAVTNPYEEKNGLSYYIPLFDFIFELEDSGSSATLKNKQVIVQPEYYLKFTGHSFIVDGGDLDK